jgi:hypothetical protein
MIESLGEDTFFSPPLGKMCFFMTSESHAAHHAKKPLVFGMKAFYALK